MGGGDAARRSLRAALAAPVALVLDADALNLISDDKCCRATASARPAT